MHAQHQAAAAATAHTADSDNLPCGSACAPESSSCKAQGMSALQTTTASSSSSACSEDAAHGLDSEPASPSAVTAADAGADTSSELQEARGPLQGYDTASEVERMAAQVLQRKQRVQLPSRAAASPHDPIHLLVAPDRNLRARKELLMTAVSGSSADGASSRVAAAKEELAGVQARLRNALGLREVGNSSDEFHTDHYQQPPLLRRTSQDTPASSLGRSANSSTGRASSVGHSSHSTSASAAAGKPLGTKAAALSFTRTAGPGGSSGSGSSSSASAAAGAAGVSSGAAARARAAGGPAGGREPAAAAAAARVHYDTSSEVAEMAARVLQRRNAAAGGTS